MGNKESKKIKKENKVAKKVDELETRYKNNMNIIKENKNKEQLKALEKERKEKIKYDMNIIVYSNEKISPSFKGMLNKVKHEEWKVIGYLEEFSEINSNKIIKRLKEDYEKKTFKNVILIPIKSINAFKETLNDNNKNIFDQFSDLEIDEQPFTIFIDYDDNDFDYSISELENSEISFENFKKAYYEKLVYDEEIEIHINFNINKNEGEKIKSLLNMIKRKKIHGDDFEIKVNDKTYYKFLYGQENKILNDNLDLFNTENNNDNFDISIIIYNSNINISQEINDYTKMGVLENNIYFYNYKSSKDKIVDNTFKSEYPELDDRNINIINYSKNIYNILFKICGYYNQFGDIILKNKMSFYPVKINIAICGPAGSGKSTLINTLLGEKRCLEGQGISITNYISQYTSLEYPITFLDFPGFGDSDNSEKLIKTIREKNLQLKNSKESIHIVLYCIKFNQRTFLSNEPDVIEELIKLNVKIIFVITRSESPNERSFTRYRKTIINEIQNIIRNKKIEPEMVKKVLGDNFEKIIIPIYCRKEKIHGQFVKTFGIDVLFNLIYDFLSPNIIDIKSIINENDTQNIFESNFFLKIYESQDKISKSVEEKITIQCSLFIFKFLIYLPKMIYSKFDEIPEILLILFLEFLYSISEIYLIEFNISEALKIFKDNILPFFNKLSDEKNQSEFKNEILLPENDEDKKFMSVVKKIMPYYKFAFPILSPLVYSLNILLLPLSSGLCKLLLKDLFPELFNLEPKFYLIKIAESLNLGIKGLKKISEKYETI